MEPADITCPNCGHSIDLHHHDDGSTRDGCWVEVAPATTWNPDGPDGICECSLWPSEIAGALLYAQLTITDEVERLRALTTVDDAMVGRASAGASRRAVALRLPAIGYAEKRDVLRAALEAALEAGEQA